MGAIHKTKSVMAMLKDKMTTEAVLWDNEVRANMMLAWQMVISMLILVSSLVLNYFGVYDVEDKVLKSIVLQGTLELLIPALLCFYYKGERFWLKAVLLVFTTIVYARVDSVLGYRTALLIAVPVVFSCRYYSRKLTATIAGLCTILFLISAASSVYMGITDLNSVVVPEGTMLVIHDSLMNSIRALNLEPTTAQLLIVLTRSFLPKYLLFMLIAIPAANIAERGKEMILDQETITQEHARIDTELGVAKTIQERALPLAPEPMMYKEFELAAVMEPAKEVGGDFYDFFFIDSTHLALLIADVSGKGVPAALFMMVSKIYLNNRAMQGGTPAEIFYDVNNRLCEKGLEDMFVSVWLGILDLTNGHLVTSSAGHEYPVICRANGDFELVKDKHGLVLSCCEDMEYPEMEYVLEPGDKIFVYTDGVAEANNSNGEQYSLERMVESLNKYKDAVMPELLSGMRSEIDAFVGEADQFDDITMLGFKLNTYMSEK